jgi:hypothetical protein
MRFSFAARCEASGAVPSGFGACRTVVHPCAAESGGAPARTLLASANSRGYTPALVSAPGL